ncbi:hypothetical protein ABC347_14170 [Sphingomonas sp. 1P06PA]|uniref:hypothetical protein n=1 Tax=Sphingomonas sp. 1P06PA TaxID=554121 RepID=UPI0039A43508
MSDALRYVATPDEWKAFCAYGEVTSTDIWVHSVAVGMGAQSGALDGYEPLWNKLVAAMKVELLAGRWVAEGFVPGQDPRPVAIDAALWRKLEFDIFEQGAAGGGFKFVNLLLTNRARSDDVASESNGNSPLSQSLELIATPDEASELSRLKKVAPRPSASVSGASDPVYTSACLQLDQLEDRLWSRLRSHLLDRTYVARGLMKGGHEIATIQAELWSVLRCRFSCDEASTPNGDLVFSHVTIKVSNLARAATERAPGTIRRAIFTFLREQFASQSARKTKEDLLEKARAMVSPSISDTMFNEVWKEIKKAGEIPEDAVYRGRPPKKAVDN